MVIIEDAPWVLGGPGRLSVPGHRMTGHRTEFPGGSLSRLAVTGCKDEAAALTMFLFVKAVPPFLPLLFSAFPDREGRVVRTAACAEIAQLLG
jgi:hypothetical protein